MLSSGNCSLEREIDKRKKRDVQTEFQKQKNETQPSHVFATSLGLVRDCMKFFFFFPFYTGRLYRCSCEQACGFPVFF